MSLNHAHEGYEYQDLLTGYFILKEVLADNLETVFSIDKKHNDNDRFDDIVITNGNKIQRKQIKYSNRNIGKILTKDFLSADSHYQIALHRLYETWKNLNTSDTEFRLCLAWDEPIDDNITDVLIEQPSTESSFASFPTKVFKIDLDRIWIESTDNSPSNFNRWDSLKTYVTEHKTDRLDFKKFCDDLLIEVECPKASSNFSKPDDLEKILIGQAEELGIGQYPNENVHINDFLDRLVKLVGNYRTQSAEKIVAAILVELGVKTNFGQIDQKFDIDTSLNITSESANDSFLKTIQHNKNILLGEPGSGKSWFLTNFIDYLVLKGIPVMRHYCFTGIGDDLLIDRVKTDIFYGNLVSSIINEFPELAGIKENKYVANLSELNILLSSIETPFVLIIDGLDHIERILKNSDLLSKNKTRIIEAISRLKTPDNISIILGSQDVEEIKFLINEFGYKEISIPKWDIGFTKQLMAKFGYEDIPFEQGNLSCLLHDKSEGNPLYLTYILKSIENNPKTLEEQIESLPQYDFNLDSYYKHLTAQLERNITADTLSCLEFSLNKRELKEIVKPAYMMESDLKILSPVIIENASRGGMRLYHDSFRRFNLEKLSEEAKQELHENIAFWLEKEGFYKSQKSYRYLTKYLIASHQYEKIKNLADIDFLVNSLWHGHSETLIKNNFKRFLKAATEQLDWPFIIYLSELNRTIYSTISEEYFSQILENFDLFFEAICVIKGTEKANALLYFNDDKNYNSHITARAFSILQKNNYEPRWGDVVDLFEKNISLNDFTYYTLSIIEDDKELICIFIKIVEEERYDFLALFIQEVYKCKGFNKILYLYKYIVDINYKIANLINKSLIMTPCIERLEIQNIEEKDLPTLNLDFIENYRDPELVASFQNTIRLYTIYDIECLTKFEETIPEKNFIYNWAKFYIRFLIAEKNLTLVELEQHVVNNIYFLISDINFFKDDPRPFDFISLNKHLVSFPIKQSLKYLTLGDSWQKVISALSKIHHDIPLILHIENNFLNDQTIPFLIEAYEKFGQSENVTYGEHAEYAFKKAIYYGKQKNKELAKLELKKALRYITGYTYRKDTSLNEIINPLSVLNKINANIALEYAKKLKYLTDTVMIHTEDGKGIKWITMNWFKKLIEIDYLLGAKYLIDQFVLKPYFWKLDYMFVDYLHMSFDKVNPVILNFMYKLSPTNNRDEYLNGFLNVLEKLKEIDTSLAKQSLIDLSERHWNDSYDSLENTSIVKLITLFDEFGLKHRLTEIDSNDMTSSIGENNVEIVENTAFLDKMNDQELLEYIKNKRSITEEESDYLFTFLQKKQDEQLIVNFLLKIIQQRFLLDDLARVLRKMICDLSISKKAKITLLVNNFIYSRNGWFASFTEQTSLEIAVDYDKDIAIKILAETLYYYFSSFGYFPESTANFIIAFSNVVDDTDTVIDMYKSGYQILENRLPGNNNFDWQDIENSEFSEMNCDELAIAMLLSKSKFHDSQVQREIICAISYFMRIDEDLLIKPFKWFFNNHEKFDMLFIATVLELLDTEKGNNKILLRGIKESLENLDKIESIYIDDRVNKIIKGI